MADILREMDPATRAFLSIFLAVMLKVVIATQWERFKARQAARPTPTKLRNGVYVPWGAVARIERAGAIIFKIWLAVMVVLLAMLIYTKYMGYSNLF